VVRKQGSVCMAHLRDSSDRLAIVAKGLNGCEVRLKSECGVEGIGGGLRWHSTIPVSHQATYPDFGRSLGGSLGPGAQVLGSLVGAALVDWRTMRLVSNAKTTVSPNVSQMNSEMMAGFCERRG
jgi:hypothetical protein